MFDRATRQFLRWRDRGDAAALGALFDRKAPELLRLALHLCGNVADAEDLLQTTFLAAIESAGRFDRRQKVTPWLVGILTHRASSERRRRQRAPTPGAEPDALPQAADGPPAAAAARELGTAAHAALERLREPFRRPTLLRLVHGMEPAEIALLLQRSPGTVRAQIHRGIEQAKRLLPQGMTLAVAAGLATTGRGLAAVRCIVLAEGARATAAAGAALSISGTAVLTGVLMSKKYLCLAIVLLGALAAFGASLWSGEGGAPPPGPGRAEAVEGPPATTLAAPVAPAAAPATERATPPPVARFEGGFLLQAQVVDGHGNRPIAGATVALHGPRTMSLLDLQRECADLSTPGPNGIPHSRSLSLRLPSELPLAVTLGGKEHPFLAPPAAEDRALASTASDADGRFGLPMPAHGGVLTVRKDGFGARQIALDGPPEEPFVVELWPRREIVGFVRTDRGEVPPVPLDFVLRADSGAWTARSDAQGRFAAEVAAERVEVECRTPGWTTTREIVDPVKGPWIVLRSLAVGEPGTIYVARFGAATLHVTDGPTGAPLETIWLRTFDQHGMPRYGGRFHAPGGYFALQSISAESALDRPKAQRDMLPSRTTATVWSDGYAPVTLRDVDLFGSDLVPIEVPLERGALEAFVGRVVRDGAPVATAMVRLRPYSRLNWQIQADVVLAAQTTAGDGAFALSAPAGDYLCEVDVDGARAAQFGLALPCAEPQTIDLAAAVFVEVAVVDARGNPQPDHNVAATGARHQRHQGKTGADGRIVLGPFARGSIDVMAPRVPAQFSWTGAVSATIADDAGSRPKVTLRLPATATMRAVLAFADAGPGTGFQGFTARDLRHGKPEATPVDPDGTVPIDLEPGSSHLQVHSADGRQWTFHVPPDAQAGHRLTLQWMGLGYAGVAITEDGRPLGNGRVFAIPEHGRDQVSARTGPDGSFRLVGLDAGRYTLGFHASADSPFREYPGNPYSMQWFRPHALPATEPTPLRIVIARFENGRFAGRDEVAVVGRALDVNGQPLADAIVSLSTLVEQDGGILELFPVSGWKNAGPDGSFRLLVGRGDRYRSSIGRKAGEPLQTAELALPGQGDEVQRDFVLR